MQVVGVDEAGRGPCIGPLFVGACSVPERDLHVLDEIGVTDSKRLRPAQREHMDNELRRLADQNMWGIVVLPLTPMRIDAAVQEQGLNRLEVEGFVEAIHALWEKGREHRLVLDACDVDATRFGHNVQSGLAVHELEPVEIDAKHRADAENRVVGAASIVAKVARDAWVRSFIERTGIDIGSGYPNDPKLKRALPELLSGNRPHPTLRWSWATTKRAWSAHHDVPMPVRTASGTSVQHRLFDPPSS